MKRQSVCRTETPGNLHCGRVCTLRLWKCQGRQQHFFSAVFAARAPAMGSSADRVWQLSQLVEGVLTAFNPSHGCPRCVSRSPEARFRVVARAVRVSQPAVLLALLVIQLFGIVIPPPYFLLRAPKGALRPFLVAALLHTFYGALRNILLSAGFPAMFHMITLEQTFANGPLQKIFSCCCF